MFRYPKNQEETVEKETITLYNLKFEYKNKFLSYKEQELEHKEENLRNNKHYKIDDKKLKELENVFKQVKVNIKLNINLKKSFEGANEAGILPEILYDIKKIGENKNLCTIYDEKNFSKKIEIEILDSILFVEKLDNKDLIFLAFNGKNYELLIYRLMPEEKKENKGYFMSQKIKETLEGYEQKYTYKTKRYSYKFDDEEKMAQPIEYNLFYIKAISKNRFFCVSNYGVKMYALNEKNEYELVLLEPYEKIAFIHEIDTNKFIFGLNLRRVEGFGFCGNAYTCYYDLLLNKIELKNIDKIGNKSNNDNLDNLKLKEKLQFSFISQTMYKSHFSSPLVHDIKVYFSDFVILKNKFFIIMVKQSILIFNMETGKEIKRFEIEVDDNRYFQYFQTDIKKWDVPENDEFILFVTNNVILFKLNEENSSKISLHIINYGYFPELCMKYIKNKNDNYYDKIINRNLKKSNSHKNRFYSFSEDSNDIIIY